MLRRLVYTFNALVAERWRDGRVLLAGDAAHMTPQFMGQGMSSGVRDAHNLAWKLDAVLRKGADPKLIDTYESERKPHAKEMIDISVKMKNFVSLANPVLAEAPQRRRQDPPEDAEGRRLHPRGALQAAADLSERRLFRASAEAPERRRGAADPAAAGAHLRRAARPARRLPRRGLRARRLRLRPARGPRRAEPRRAVRARRSLRRALSLRRAAAGRRSRRGCRGSPALVEVEDLGGEGVAWFRGVGAKKGRVALVRPDKFVYALAPASGAADIVTHALRAMKADRAPTRERS